MAEEVVDRTEHVVDRQPVAAGDHVAGGQQRVARGVGTLAKRALGLEEKQVLVFPDVFHHVRGITIRFTFAGERLDPDPGLLHRPVLGHGLVGQGPVGLLDLWVGRLVLGLLKVVGDLPEHPVVDRRVLLVRGVLDPVVADVRPRDPAGLLVAAGAAVRHHLRHEAGGHDAGVPGRVVEVGAGLQGRREILRRQVLHRAVEDPRVEAGLAEVGAERIGVHQGPEFLVEPDLGRSDPVGLGKTGVELHPHAAGRLLLDPHQQVDHLHRCGGQPARRKGGVLRGHRSGLGVGRADQLGAVAAVAVGLVFEVGLDVGPDLVAAEVARLDAVPAQRRSDGLVGRHGTAEHIQVLDHLVQAHPEHAAGLTFTGAVQAGAVLLGQLPRGPPVGDEHLLVDRAERVGPELLCGVGCLALGLADDRVRGCHAGLGAVVVGLDDGNLATISRQDGRERRPVGPVRGVVGRGRKLVLLGRGGADVARLALGPGRVLGLLRGHDLGRGLDAFAGLRHGAQDGARAADRVGRAGGDGRGGRADRGDREIGDWQGGQEAGGAVLGVWMHERDLDGAVGVDLGDDRGLGDQDTLGVVDVADRVALLDGGLGRFWDLADVLQRAVLALGTRRGGGRQRDLVDPRVDGRQAGELGVVEHLGL